MLLVGYWLWNPGPMRPCRSATRSCPPGTSLTIHHSLLAAHRSLPTATAALLRAITAVCMCESIPRNHFLRSASNAWSAPDLGPMPINTCAFIGHVLEYTLRVPCSNICNFQTEYSWDTTRFATETTAYLLSSRQADFFSAQRRLVPFKTLPALGSCRSIYLPATLPH